MKTHINFFRTGLLMGLVFIMAACIQQDSYLEESPPEDGVILKSATTDALDLTDRYIVTFRNRVVNPVAETARLKGMFGFETGHVYEHALKGFSAKIPPQALNGLRNHPLIELIEPDQIQSINAQTIPTGIRRIGTLQSLYIPIDGVEDSPDVDIAVIDTGIDKEHPDLLVSGGVKYASGVASTSYDDDHGHGSHVAGTIAARDNTIGVVGVVPGARLWAVKVLNSRGSGYTSDIIKGIDWVTARASTIEVVNMSIGGAGYNSSYRTALANCVAKGVVVMVAAGNEATDVYGADRTFGTSDDRVPAAFPEVATISAYGDSDGLPGGKGANTSYGKDDSFASFSNYSYNVVAGNPVNSPGKAIDLILPGVNIYSAYKDMNYATMSGTSMACPHAAGLAALYILQKGRANNAAGVYAIRQALIDAAWPQSDTTYGLTNGGDPDPNKEKLGWAVFGVAPPPTNQPPVANAGSNQTVRDTDGSGSETVTLNGSASTDDNGITSWKWELGATNIGTTSAFSYAFPVGQHTVTLTVSDAGNLSSTDQVVITVLANQAPVANFSFVTNGLNVTFTDQSTDDGTITGWSWDFEDGGSSAQRNPVYDYGTAGTYTVRLTVTDNGLATSSITKTVTVSQPVAPVIKLTASIYKLNRVQWAARLTWSGATTANVDVYMNGKLVITTTNDGDHVINLGKTVLPSYTFRVCNAGSTDCSPDVIVSN
jgi:PKD repeat protein